jgi:glycolate oxidase
VIRRPPFPRPSAASIDKAKSLLDRALGPSKVITSPEACLNYAGDESDQEPVVPDAVVVATSREDVARALAVAAEAEVPITPRGGGSGKSGGAVPVGGGIVLATVGLESIKEIDREELVAVVEPGVILGDFHAAVESESLFFPPDPSSLSYCALGGNVAENAAGPRAFKYGAMRDYVLGLEALLVDGTALRTGRRTVKGVTGYDVTSLLVGSEGTLGVFTEITVQLLPKPPAVVTLLALFDSIHACGRAVSAIIAAGLVPRCLELLDAGALAAVRGKGVNIDARANALLLIEIDGDLPSCELGMERVGEVCTDKGALDVLVAADAAQRDRLWEARRALSPATRAMARFKISEDVVVPRTRLPDLLAEIERISEESGIPMLSYGHAGDGNLHVNFLWDDPDASPRVEKGMERLFRAVIGMRGTLTGEHGIGTSKAEYLPLEQSAELIDLQRRLKAVFDPKGLLNPHKIFPRRGHGVC